MRPPTTSPPRDKRFPKGIRRQAAEFLQPFGLTLFAALTLVVAHYLYRHAPVGYTLLIAEDQWGEYMTAACFGLAGILWLIPAAGAFRTRPWPRIVWGMTGAAALLIAGEEMSWGQRILGLTAPSFLRAYNTQNELTFHNLEGVSSLPYHDFGGWLLLGWVLFSALLRLAPQGLRSRFEQSRLPLSPLPLAGMFLLVPYFWLAFPLAKSDEVGELVLGMGVLALAVSQFQASHYPGFPGRLLRRGKTAGAMALAGILAWGMAFFFPGDLAQRLNLMAKRDYPEFAMHEQAFRLYDYIYAHPRYLLPQTRNHHAALLFSMGRKEEACRVLATAVREFETGLPLSGESCEYLRSFALSLMMLGEKEPADKRLQEAIHIDEGRLDAAASSNERAKILWSLARTHALSGDIAKAVATAREAKTATASARLNENLDKWIQALETGNRPVY